MAPLAIDLCCGLGGWTEGLLAEGWNVRGYDIEAHEYGEERYPAELVLQSILDLDGADCADADLIVASPPCTEFSYMAMPWSRAKQIARALRGEGDFPEGYRGSRTVEELNALFNACFRIQREASQAAGRHIPMVVENVKGAQPWVGRAAWSFGSYFLWGDIPALMPIQRYHERLKVKAGEQWNVNRENFTGTRGWDEELKTSDGRKNGGGSWFNIGSPGQKETGRNPAHAIAREIAEGRKGAGAGAEWFDQNLCKLSSKSPARKAASAKIAKIPFALSSHIARVYLPERTSEAA
jgi:SAM-dependent methyltransferase